MSMLPGSPSMKVNAKSSTLTAPGDRKFGKLYSMLVSPFKGKKTASGDPAIFLPDGGSVPTPDIFDMAMNTHNAANQGTNSPKTETSDDSSPKSSETPRTPSSRASPHARDSRALEQPQNCDWTDRESHGGISQYDAYAEMRDAQSRSQKAKMSATQKAKISSMRKDLQRLVQDAEKAGHIKMTRQPQAPAPAPVQQPQQKPMKDMQDLLVLVKQAQSSGHLKILRRQSTDAITITGGAQLKLI